MHRFEHEVRKLPLSIFLARQLGHLALGFFLRSLVLVSYLGRSRSEHVVLCGLGERAQQPDDW